VGVGGAGGFEGDVRVSGGGPPLVAFTSPFDTALPGCKEKDLRLVWPEKSTPCLKRIQGVLDPQFQLG
jgi:hypothetical protein